jgi:hypothetical protein
MIHPNDTSGRRPVHQAAEIVRAAATLTIVLVIHTFIQSLYE